MASSSWNLAEKYCTKETEIIYKLSKKDLETQHEHHIHKTQITRKKKKKKNINKSSNAPVRGDKS